MPKIILASIEIIINVAKKGGMFILVDDEKEKMKEILLSQLQTLMLKILILWPSMVAA